jgi:hypothetical protein
MERCGPRPAVNRRRHESQRRTPIQIPLISRLGLLYLLATMTESWCDARKTAVFDRKSRLEKIFGIFLPGPLQFLFARIILSCVADESL